MSYRVAGAALAVMLATGAAAQQLAEEGDRREARRHYRAGQELLYAEAWEKAAAEFQAAIRLDPLLTLAYYGLGQANMGLKNYPAAIRAFIGCREAFHNIAKLQTSNKLAVDRLRDDELRELRDSLSLIQGSSSAIKYINPLTLERLQSRIRDLEKERQRPSTRPFQTPAEVSLALGSAYFRSGALEDAEREYRAAIDVNPKLGEAHNNLAVVCMMTGRLDEAEQEVKLAEKSGFKVHPQFKQDLKARRQ